MNLKHSRAGELDILVVRIGGLICISKMFGICP